MDKKAVEAAKVEFQRASDNVAAVVAARDFQTFENAWTAFLTAGGRIFTKLEQGSKSSPRSAAWWGRKLHERRTDPLLCYIWHARNVDEHTLQQVTQRRELAAKEVQPTAEDIEILREKVGRAGKPFTPLGLFQIQLPHVVLGRVVDKGTPYDPPKEHMGQKIDDPGPNGVAQLALAYYATILREADELVPP